MAAGWQPIFRLRWHKEKAQTLAQIGMERGGFRASTQPEQKQVLGDAPLSWREGRHSPGGANRDHICRCGLQLGVRVDGVVLHPKVCAPPPPPAPMGSALLDAGHLQRSLIDSSKFPNLGFLSGLPCISSRNIWLGFSAREDGGGVGSQPSLCLVNSGCKLSPGGLLSSLP